MPIQNIFKLALKQVIERYVMSFVLRLKLILTYQQKSQKYEVIYGYSQADFSSMQ